MDKNSLPESGSSKGQQGSNSGVAAVIVVGLFVICVVFLFARGLFSSNSADAPSGLDTATINTDISQPDDTQLDNSEGALTSAYDNSQAASGIDSAADEQTSDSSQAQEEALEVMYITEYAYLHTQPSNDSENIICMSPGIEVTVLNYEDNGYVKVTFMNIDGQLTGYIYKDYLSQTQTVVPSWQQD